MNINDLNKWQDEFDADSTYKLAATTLQHYDAGELLCNKGSKFLNVFSHVIDPEGAPITNQKSSGRCWLFAGLNMLRVKAAKTLDMKEFQLSQTYMFFYDKLEKANYFLDKVIETYEEDVGSRLIQTLLTSPVEDGGQFTMFVNLVEKYGVVPLELYPDVYSSTASRKLDELLTSKLREAAEVLRDLKKDGKDPTDTKNEYVKEIYKYLTIFLGKPPKVDEEFVYEYYDKDKKYGKITSTPINFYKDIVKLDVSNTVSIINDPRNPYHSKIKIQHLNNMSGGRPVEYINLPNEILTKLIVKRIKANKPVFFGSHTPKYMNTKTGIMDKDYFGYSKIGYEIKQCKKSRVLYNESLMTHAMLITGVNIDEKTGLPNRYRIENSWGKDSGLEGYFIMSQEYFEEYCFQIVVDIEEIEEFKHILAEEPVVLPLWDPMGALARL